ncbi:MAG: integrase arm-type DNA-binding domain-containing protein [Moraxellaceae bacterium]|nr:integrase arm-type DNA-binding domain-containing protein [Moraxellaceae bacterium]
MPKIIASKTAKQLERINKIGYTAVGGDANGLNIYIKATGLRSWVFRFSINGKRCEMGLGLCADISLPEARKLASEARDLVNQGINPIDKRKVAIQETIIKNETKYATHLFKDLALKYIDNKSPEWRNHKVAPQWRETLKTYAFPIIGNKDVKNITVHDIVEVLNPIWLTKNSTATRVRGRMENVIDYAISAGYRSEANPASQKALRAHLPKASKVHTVKHHAALPYDEVPALLNLLYDSTVVSHQALAFTILTAKRSNEIRGACWGEIDFENKIWNIPANRMKNHKPHREPLSPQTILFLKGLLPSLNSPLETDLIFVSPYRGTKLSDMALLEALKHLRPGFTVHGFRSSFRQWSAEQTDYGHHICEMALAHSVLTNVELAYQRSDLLEKRRLLMEDWSDFLFK